MDERNRDRRIIHEITPLMGKDVLYIADRRKKEFTYPIHNHEVYELNFVEHAPGVRRIVGDSQEVIGEYDLVLITSPDLEHVWEQYECKSDHIREVTVQFDFKIEDDNFFSRNPFESIRKMMLEARKGLAFPMTAIMNVYHMIDTLSKIEDGFYAVQQFLSILYELSKVPGYRTLATSSYAKVAIADDSRRVLKVKQFINDNYMDEIRLLLLQNLSKDAFHLIQVRSFRQIVDRLAQSIATHVICCSCCDNGQRMPTLKHSLLRPGEPAAEDGGLAAEVLCELGHDDVDQPQDFHGSFSKLMLTKTFLPSLSR